MPQQGNRHDGPFLTMERAAGGSTAGDADLGGGQIQVKAAGVGEPALGHHDLLPRRALPPAWAAEFGFRERLIRVEAAELVVQIGQR